jgi:hypothetical protein
VEEVVNAQCGLEMHFYICVPRLGEDSQVFRKLDFFRDAISVENLGKFV